MNIGPHLLKSRVLNWPTRVFLCGPGLGTSGYEIRQEVRDALASIKNVEVTFGEEIEQLTHFRKRKYDLQTLEYEFAHSVDLTVLLLNSPGSIAELGTFSMVKNLRGRLVVLVPSSFYRASSYIARGPLSIIAREHASNVIYYDDQRRQQLRSRVLYPLTFYKYAHDSIGNDYQRHLISGYRQRSYHSESYEEFIKDVRAAFSVAITLIATLILGMPTFAELVAYTYQSPQLTSSALHVLLRDGKISKLTSGHYHPTAGFSDSLLAPFNSTAVSHSRAVRIACLGQRKTA